MPGHGQVSGPKPPGDGKDPTPADDATGASSDESGYRRDDYWRKSQQGLSADAESEPEHGQSFESPEERARSGHRVPGKGTEDHPGDDSPRSGEAPIEHDPPHAG